MAFSVTISVGTEREIYMWININLIRYVQLMHVKLLIQFLAPAINSMSQYLLN